MRVLITGGAGFLGGHIAREMARRLFDVVVLYDVDTSNEGEIRKDVASVGSGTKLEVIKGDVTDFDMVRHVVEYFKIQEIVHLAGVSHTVSSALGQVSAWMPGAVGLATLYDVVHDLGARSDVRRISIASSSLVSGMLKVGSDGMVGNGSTGIDLADCYHQYVDNKLAMEMICHDNFYQFGVGFTVFRFGTQYGPRMKRNVVTWYFIRNALLRIPLEVHGDGRQVRQHFYCDDLARAVALIVDRYDVFNEKTVSIVPPYMVSVNDIADAVARAVPGTGIVHVDRRSIDVKVHRIRVSEDLKRLGWEPVVSLDDGIKRTVEYYRERMHLVKDGFDKRIKEEN